MLDIWKLIGIFVLLILFISSLVSADMVVQEKTVSKPTLVYVFGNGTVVQSKVNGINQYKFTTSQSKFTSIFVKAPNEPKLIKGKFVKDTAITLKTDEIKAKEDKPANPKTKTK